MNTISLNHEPNSISEIKMLSNMTWKEIVSMLVRTDESFLSDLWGNCNSDKQNHVVKLTVARVKDDRYIVSIEFIWKEKDGYHRSHNSQEFFRLLSLPQRVWDGLLGPEQEFSVLLHASELKEYKSIILNYNDKKVQVYDGGEGIIELVRSKLKKNHADTGSYSVEIIPQKLLNKVVVYYDSINRYECLSFFSVYANDLSLENTNDLKGGKPVILNVIYNKTLF